MAVGIRVEVRIDEPDACTVAAAAAAVEETCYSISRSVNPEEPDRLTGEFILEGDLTGVDLPTPVETIFSYGAKTAYRFERPLDVRCPCDVVASHDCPLVDIYTRAGAVHLSFHAPDMATLQEVVQALRTAYPSLSVQRLLRSEDDHTDHSIVFVDRGALTDRQREVLERAHELGYFDYPKGTNATEVASDLDISPATFAEHLAAAQRKLLGPILDS